MGFRVRENDSTASEILRCAQYLAGFLGTAIFVDHVGRMSDDLAGLADELSRKETSTKENGARALSYAEFRRVDTGQCTVKLVGKPLWEKPVQESAV